MTDPGVIRGVSSVYGRRGGDLLRTGWFGGDLTKDMGSHKSQAHRLATRWGILCHSKITRAGDMAVM